MRFGSAFDSTRVARISSPETRRTPTARSPLVRTDSTSASQRTVGTGLARRVGHPLGEHAHAAAHEAPLADAGVAGVAGVVVQQHERGARRRRAGDAVVDRVPAEGGADVLALEPLGQHLTGARGEQLDQLVEVLAVLGREPPHRRQRAQVVEAAHARVGRGHVEDRQHGLDDVAELLLEDRQGAGVGGREALGRLDVRGHVVAEQIARAVGVEVEAWGRPRRRRCRARPASCPARSPVAASRARRRRSRRGSRARTPRCCRRRRRTGGARG